ncbi:MAG: DUF2721 domain-containing protein [Chloroflexi bacterium]|nr:DUF2721 domain-containing protein [Chloroflexota bacterium]
MITPALLILASGSLVATALVRLSRVVDRSRVLIGTIDASHAVETDQLRNMLGLHQRRALYAERSVELFFVAVVIFVLDCLTLGLDYFAGNSLTLIPIVTTIVGMFVLIAGAAYMVAESQLGARQIVQEIDLGRARLAEAGGTKFQNV